MQIQAQRRSDDMIPMDEDSNDSGWQPAAVEVEQQQQPTAAFVVSATQTFSEADTMPAIDRRNDWKSIETDAGIVQSPMLHVQSQFSVDQVTGVDQRPHYEPWIQRERHMSTSTTTSTTVPPPKNNKSYRRPYQGRRNEDSIKTALPQSVNGPKVAADLKNILKQTGGLSLSEILQQQNVSLDDLLKGKQDALKALQNTAAPPSPSPNEASSAIATAQPTDDDDNDEETAKKPMRRLPAMHQLQVIKPRRNFYNGTTRMVANPNQIDASSTASTPIESVSVSSEAPREVPIAREITPIEISSTHPTYASNSRKRLPNMKFLKSKYHSQVSSTLETQPENEQNEMKNASVASNESNEEEKIEQNIINSSAQPVASSTTTTVSTTAFVPKMNMRERLAFRPPRLRNVPSSQSPSSSTVESSSEIISSRMATTTTNIPASSASVPSEEPLPYTIITFATPSTESTPSIENVEMDDSNDKRPINDELNKKLNESVPELNLVDLEDESKSKEVSSLEDLFISSADSMDPINNSGDELPNETDDLGGDDEFIHASATSRSDLIYKSDKPNSLKIFGGNLVNIIRKTIDKLDVTERNPGLFTDIVMAKNIDDKTELMVS